LRIWTRQIFLILVHLLVTTSGLLLLALALLVASRASKGLLEDLKDLFVLNLLVGLELLEIGGVGGSKFGNTVLGDSCDMFSSCI
jgi:hypothetical protein